MERGGGAPNIKKILFYLSFIRHFTASSSMFCAKHQVTINYTVRHILYSSANVAQKTSKDAENKHNENLFVHYHKKGFFGW